MNWNPSCATQTGQTDAGSAVTVKSGLVYVSKHASLKVRSYSCGEAAATRDSRKKGKQSKTDNSHAAAVSVSIKLAFHDADTDTDTDFLARKIARVSGARIYRRVGRVGVGVGAMKCELYSE